MQKFHYKEYFWDVTKKIMTVFNDKDEPVYQLKMAKTVFIYRGIKVSSVGYCQLGKCIKMSS